MATRAEQRELIENALLLSAITLPIFKVNSLKAKVLAKEGQGYRLRWFNKLDGFQHRLIVKSDTFIDEESRMCAPMCVGNEKGCNRRKKGKSLSCLL